jgi:hypothetical protein
MDFTYTVNRRTVNAKLTDTFILWFFGDVHRDASSCDVDRWKEFLKQAEKDDPEKTFYMGMGDYHDFASAREQKKLLKNELHETTMEMIHEIPRRRNREFAEEIKFMRGRLLGIIAGNHNWTFENGYSASEDLADRMGAPHLGYLCHFSLTFRFPGNKVTTLYIVGCHGKAGGKRAGASINQVEDMRNIFTSADIYVMGHDHQRGAWPINALVSVSGDVKQKRQLLCRSGSYMKSYQEDKSQYTTGRIMRPADLGSLRITVNFKRLREEGFDRINVILKSEV